jgi:seryl-tRNA synthetase
VPGSAVNVAQQAVNDLPIRVEVASAVSDFGDSSNSEQVRLKKEIERLWAKHSVAEKLFKKSGENHSDAQGTFRKSREELRGLRDELSKVLYELKPLMCCLGRASLWVNFLNCQDIPRSTADHLVRVYQKTLTPEEKNCATEQIPEQPETAIRSYLHGLWPRLSKVVKTPKDLEMFITALREKSFASKGESFTSPAQEARNTEPQWTL